MIIYKQCIESTCVKFIGYTARWCLWSKPLYVHDIFFYFAFLFPFQPNSPKTESPENGLKKHLLQACQDVKANNVTDFQKRGSLTEGKWIISRNYKLVNCVVHKAGSTNIGRILYVLDHLDEYSDTNQLSRHLAWKGPKFNKKYETEASFEDDFKSYTKFMCVRDPIERLLSAYRAHLPIGMFRLNYNMTFEAFLETVAEIPDQKIEPHLASLSRMCSPCRMQFDFIASTDSFGEDMNSILTSVGANKYLTLPERNQTGYPHRKSSEVLEEYLKGIPKPLVKKIYEKFYWDYFLFGFTKPDF